MAVNKWAYEPSKCDGDFCIGDCDLCGKANNSDGERRLVMDLYAHSQIEKYKDEISDILKHIPRLRGIRKMSEEDPQEEDCYQLERFNSYCGKENVYMIHARIGGTEEYSNWVSYEGEKTIASQPWFLEKVDDDFDNTYCDIYVTTDYKGSDE